MKPIFIVALDLLKEARARKWFIAFGVAITAALTLIGLSLRLEVVDGALAATRFFGRDVNSDITSVDVAMQPIFRAASYIVFYGGLIFGTLACADFGPSLLAPGRIEHLLSLPVRRSQLLLGTFLGVLVLALAGSVYGAGGFTVLLAIKTGSWNFGLLGAGLLACVSFCAVYGAVLVSTLYIRSTPLSALVGLMVFVLGVIAGFRNEIAELFEAGIGRASFEWMTLPFPQISALAIAAGNIAGSAAVNTLALLKLIAAHLMFGFACILVGIWRFERMDF